MQQNSGKILFILFAIFFICCSTKKDRTVVLEITKIDLARNAIESGELENALELLNEIISQDTLNGEAYFLRAKCYVKLPGPNLSTPDYLKSIELGYRISDSYFNLGMNELSSGNDSLASKYFEKVIEIDSNNKDAAYYLKMIQQNKRFREGEISI